MDDIVTAGLAHSVAELEVCIKGCNDFQKNCSLTDCKVLLAEAFDIF